MVTFLLSNLSPRALCFLRSSRNSISRLFLYSQFLLDLVFLRQNFLPSVQFSNDAKFLRRNRDSSVSRLKISFLPLPYQVFLLFRRRLYIFAYNIVVCNRHGRFQDNFYKDRNVRGIFLASLTFVRIQIVRWDKENSDKFARAELVQLDERMLEITRIIRPSCLWKNHGIVKRESIISRFITCQRTDIISR